MPSYSSGGSFAVLLLAAVAVSSRASPQIQHISAFTSAPKPVRRLNMNSTLPRPKIQRLKCNAEDKPKPPELRRSADEGSEVKVHALAPHERPDFRTVRHLLIEPSESTARVFHLLPRILSLQYDFLGGSVRPTGCIDQCGEALPHRQSF